MSDCFLVNEQFVLKDNLLMVVFAVKQICLLLHQVSPTVTDMKKCCII